MAVAKLLLKNDVGLILDITESPLGCTVYDLEGNEIGGGGGSDGLSFATMTLAGFTGFNTFSFTGAFLETEDDPPYVYGYTSAGFAAGTYKVILYNGYGAIYTESDIDSFIVSGNATKDEEGFIHFTGDFTVTKA